MSFARAPAPFSHVSGLFFQPLYACDGLGHDVHSRGIPRPKLTPFPPPRALAYPVHASVALKQVKSLTVRAEELQRKLEEAGESNRMITQAVRLKQDEVDKLSIANEAISRRLKVRGDVL